MTLSNNIKQIRWEKGLSLRQLEKLSGVDHSTIGKIENEEVSPTQDIMIAISKGLNKRTTDVFNLDW